MLRKVLIVDDDSISLQLLHNILSSEYDVIEARNGQDALTEIHRGYKYLSAVVLDLVMPVMDGFEVLRAVRENAALSQIPMIVASAAFDEETEVRALSHGANDFICKPYNPALILHCLRNTIALRESASIVNALQRDRLTGLFNRETFFEKADALIRTREAGYYTMSCFDIDNFKLINDRYGATVGDRILKRTGEIVRCEILPSGGVVARISADNFAILYPTAMKIDGEEFIRRMRKEQLIPDDQRYFVSFSVGRYIVNDPSLPASAAYDRAFLAKQSIKGRYDERIAYFNDSMLEKLVREQEITGEMNHALDTRQFEVWFQPQFNHSTGAVIGSEALVRWRHPQRGIISPGDFIPVFEQNGFIYELDKFVWEEVCRELRRWIDGGHAPLPVSVNISRYDLFRTDLTDTLKGLLDEYSLPVGLLRLEITESAFAKSPEHITHVVNGLVGEGFTVEIDDFGSGYSSLNTLKDVQATVLKLDMRFLESGSNSQRGGNIVESIVRMAKWLGMSVIAEGVEKVQQADYLKSIGCSYVQGYLYARPMPREEFETLLASSGKEMALDRLKTIDRLDNDRFWDPDSMETLIFNSYVEGACILEYQEGRIELLRANDKYTRVIGGAGISIEDALRINWRDHLDRWNDEVVRAALERSIATGEEVTENFVFRDLPGCPKETHLRSTLRVIASTGNRYLVYCTNENINAQRIAERKERLADERLSAVMRNINGGVTATVLRDGKPVILLANDSFYTQLGYTEEQYQREVTSPYDLVHPDDRRRVADQTEKCSETQQPFSADYRIIRRDGSIRWFRSNISVGALPETAEPVQIAVANDITEEHQTTRELLDNLPAGTALCVAEGDVLLEIHFNKCCRELFGMEKPDSNSLGLLLERVHPDDRGVLIDVFSAEGDNFACDTRIISDGEFRLFRVLGKRVRREDGKTATYLSFTPTTDEALIFRRMLPVTLSTMMSASTDMTFVKDASLRFICCSRTFAEMCGATDELDIIGKTDADYLSPALVEKYRETDEEIIRTAKAKLDYFEDLPPSEDNLRFGRTSKYPLLDSDGNVMAIYGVTRDITEYHTAFERLSLLAGSIPGGLATYAVSPDKIKLQYFNEGFCALFGYTADEYKKRAEKNAMSLVFKEDLPELKRQLAALIADGTPINCIYRVHHKDGSCKWISHKASAALRQGNTVIVNAVLTDITDQREATERLRISEEEHRLAVRHSGNILGRFMVSDRSLDIGAENAARFSLPEKLAGLPQSAVSLGIVDTDSENAFTAFYNSIIDGTANGSGTFHMRLGGEWRWVEAKYSTIFSRDSEPVSAVISFGDITEQLEKEAVYTKWQQSLHEKAPEDYTLFRCNLNKNTSFDTVEGNLFGFTFSANAHTFNAKTAEYAYACVDPADRGNYIALLDSDALLAKYYRGNRTESLDYREMYPGGGYRWLRLTVELVEYPNSTDIEAYMMFENIDEVKSRELQALALAETDPLTGIFNRAAFIAKTCRALGAGGGSTASALLMFDLDGFKLVNDRLGHAAGDSALIDISKATGLILGGGDIFGRLGGDEFLVFLGADNREEIGRKAGMICSAVRRSFEGGVRLSASIGIAVAPDDGSDFDTLYRKADTALYYVKETGKDSFAFYNDDMKRDDPAAAFPRDINPEHTKRTRDRRMLIVDDNPVNRDMFAAIFTDDFITETADDGEAALIRLRRSGGSFSVVLLDLIMPGMDGFAVLEKMRRSREMQAIPVVVVSGESESETALRTIRYGASDFVTKPVDPDLLRLRVESAVARAENEALRAREFRSSTEEKE